MKVKQKVAALCLAAVVATSGGAAAVSGPPANLGRWDHGYLPASKLAYSYFGFNMDNKEERWHAAWAQIDKEYVLKYMLRSLSDNGRLKPMAEVIGTGKVQCYWYKFDVK
ncbi:MAG: hypothetical protein J5789_09950 [Oscillospiraceae bacterium]|nr:hypothetical protein [Oscillospiraceae bacterium]